MRSRDSQGSYSTSVSYNSIGRLSQVTSGSISIFDWKYEFDDLGNLSSREDVENDQKEIFSYDKLRLSKIELYENQGNTHISSADISMAYDECGNIISKTNLSDDIDYGEGTAGPLALTTINDPDASYTPPPQVITYKCFNKVSSIMFPSLDFHTTISLQNHTTVSIFTWAFFGSSSR